MVQVTEGLIHIDWIDLLHHTDDFIVYEIGTSEKHPEVISWNSDSLTILPGEHGERDWDLLTANDYTVIRFPEKRDWCSVYQEDRYSIFFIQFKIEKAKTVWSKEPVLV